MRGDGAASMAVGAGSLAALAALTGGLPAALYAAGGSPVPHGLPSWHQVIAALARPDDGTMFLAAVRWVSWLAWAAFTLSAAAEMLAQLRGRAAPRLRLAGPVQSLATALVASVFVSLLPAPHLPRTAPVAVSIAQIAGTAPARPGTPARTTAGGPDGTGRGWVIRGRLAVPPGGRYIVAERDDLWGIAARRLGDGERWREIFALNRGRLQPDGRRLTDPRLIYPGWILLLPSSQARPRASAHHGACFGPRRPDGGLPAPRAGSQPGSAPAAATRQPGRPRDHTAQRPAGIGLPGGSLVGITLAAAVSTALAAWRLHRRRAAVPRWPARPGQVEAPLPDAITRLRRAYLRSLGAEAAGTRSGPWPDPRPPGPAACRAAEDEAGLDEFGAPVGPAAPGPGTGHPPAAPHPAASGRPAPAAAWAGAAPAPFRPAVPRWPLVPGPQPGAAGRRGGDPAAGRQVPQAPGTIVFGQRAGAEIPLADAAAGGLGLTGPGAHDAARAVLISLLASPRSHAEHGPQVVIPAADLRLLVSPRHSGQVPGVTPGYPGGLAVTGSLDEALDRIETEITHRIRVQDAGTDDYQAGPGRQAPPLAVIATAGPRSHARLRAVLDAGQPAGILAIVIGTWPAGTTCQISSAGIVTAATRPGLTGIDTYRLQAPDTAALLDLLRGAQGHVTDEPASSTAAPARPARHEPAPEARRDASGSGGQPGRHARPAASRAEAGPPPGRTAPEPGYAPGSAPASRDARPVEIAVLGTVRITAAGSELRSGLRKARELLAFLVMHPAGVTGDAISEALWPESDPRYAARQRHLAVRKGRELLRTATGLRTPMFITLAGDRYQLDPSLIGADLWRFDTALDQAQAATDQDDQLTALRRATACYHGPLCDGTAFDWTERYAEPARRRAVDALARIAGILQPASPEQALATLETALVHDPYNEALYQRIMHIQVGLGRPDAARRTLRLLETRLAELGLAPDPATRQAAGAAGNQVSHRPTTSPRPS